jgi:TPR repeat protein
MAHKVFICHSSQDKQIADAACAALESARIPCWIAPRDILAGEEYGKAIIDALSGCEIVLLIFSRDANDSPQVRREIERSVSKGKIIVPFRIEQVSPSDAMEYALSNTHWLDAITPPMEGRLADLCATIAKLIERRQDSDPLRRPKEEAAVTPPQAAAEPAVVKAVERPFRAPEPEPEPESAPRRRWGVIGGVAVAVVLAAGGVFAYMHHSGSSASESVAATESTPAPVPQQPAPQDNATPAQPNATSAQPAASATPPPATRPAATPAAASGSILTPAPSAAPPPVPAASAAPAERPAAIAEQARQLYADKRYLKAFPLAKESCAQNNPQSCYLLGNMYVGGYGVATDAKAGAELIQKACQAEVQGACGTLGVLYASGNGVPQDHPKALSLLNNSCDKGYAADCFTLGKIFGEPLYGYNRQFQRAQAYFRKACDDKLEQACNHIRNMDDMPAAQPERRHRTPAS